MNTETITIVVNGFAENLPAGAEVDWLIAYFKQGDTDLIAAHNGRFVYPKDCAAKTLAAGDRVELINPNFGG